MTNPRWSNWEDLGGSFVNLGVASNADGHLEVFVLTRDGALLHKSQLSPGGDWSEWLPLGLPHANLTPEEYGLVVSKNRDGRIEAFRILKDGLWHIFQTAPNNGWSGWQDLGKPKDVTFDDVVVARNQDGRLEAIALTSHGILWHNWQTSHHLDWSHWKGLGNPHGPVFRLVVERDSNGVLQAFAIGMNAFWNISQALKGWKWNQLAPLPENDPIVDIAVGRNSLGLLELFVTTLNSGRVLRNYQQKDTGQQLHWSGWSSLGSPQNEKTMRIAVTLNQDKVLQALVTTDKGSIWTIAQSSDSQTSWSNWESLDTPADASLVAPVVARNRDGRLELFAMTNSGAIMHVRETQQTQLQWFNNLVANVAPVVYMHPDEPYMPSSFEWYLQKTRYVDGDGHDHGTLAPAMIGQPPFGKNGYLTYSWNDQAIRKGDLATAVCYAHVTARSDALPGYDVQYWFFSPFNGPATVGLTINAMGHKWNLLYEVPPCGEHEGDWENIVVRVDPSGTIQRIYCSQHGGGAWYGRSSKPGAPDGYTLEDGHPVIYSSLNGHPSFPWEGEFPTLTGSGIPAGISLKKGDFSVTGGLLNVTKRGIPWECFRPESHNLLAIDSPDFPYNSNTWWFPFQGRVGELNPGLGDMEKEAAENLEKNLIGTIGSGFAGTLALSQAIIQALIFAAPHIESPRGPTALAAKDDWPKSAS